MTLRAALLALLVLPAALGHAKPGESPLDHALSPAKAHAALKRVFGDVENVAKLGKRPLVVFDLDDTLIQSTPHGHWIQGKRRIRGALAYVRSLEKDGATVVYLTARHGDIRPMTEDQLRELGFPRGEGTHLLMNEESLPATKWKAKAKELVLALGKPVAFFDNDRRMARLFRSQYPDSRVFRIKFGLSRPDPGQGPGRIYVIENYGRWPE